MLFQSFSSPPLLIILLSTWSALAGFPYLERDKEDGQGCDNPIGRIDAGTSVNHYYGDFVCEDEQIVEPDSVLFLCFFSGERIQLDESTVINSSICQNVSEADNESNRASNCSIENGQSICFSPKIPSTGDQFLVLQPNRVSGPRPTIEWEVVPNAESYRVYLTGPDVNWERTVEGGHTILDYPDSEPSLATELAYEVTVLAKREEEVTASASKVINIGRTVASSSLQLEARTKGAQ